VLQQFEPLDTKKLRSRCSTRACASAAAVASQRSLPAPAAAAPQDKRQAAAAAGARRPARTGRTSTPPSSGRGQVWGPSRAKAFEKPKQESLFWLSFSSKSDVLDTLALPIQTYGSIPQSFLAAAC